ncbi:MAG: hypothetical protein RLY20_627 [Verrucomicrobiota bacterium]
MTAIEEFNQSFGLSISAPDRAGQQEAILFANKRGRPDIAQKLREHFDAQRVAESIRRETLRPVVGAGWSEANKRHEENAAEARQQLRGAKWWIKQGVTQ